MSEIPEDVMERAKQLAALFREEIALCDKAFSLGRLRRIEHDKAELYLLAAADVLEKVAQALLSERNRALKEAADVAQPRFGSPPEPVVNPSASWCEAYADWYYQGKG